MIQRKILAVVGMLAAACAAQAQTIEADSFDQLRVTFTVDDIDMQRTVVDGREFTRLAVEGMLPSAQVGAPELPVWSALVEVPVCEGYELTVSDVEYDTVTLDGPAVAPRQPSRSKSDLATHPLAFDAKVYATNAYHTAGPLATVEAVGIARDRHLARLQFAPLSYNPVSGKLAVCRRATVTVRYTGSDPKATRELLQRHHSPLMNLGASTFNSLCTNAARAVRTTAPVRYLIVAHSMFRGQLNDFVAWKRRKGFVTDIVYTGDAGVGTTSASIAAYVKSQYTNATAANPAPTYLLLVGDHEQIPAFASQVSTPDNDHITDLYYATWTTGDHLPDCHYGRFSAQSLAQLTPQVEKTLMYEQYGFADPTFLDRAVMVAGVDLDSVGDLGYTHADPAMDYAITNYVNGSHGYSQVTYFKNNTSIVPTGSNVTVHATGSAGAQAARAAYNAGAGLVNYSAHGSATGWGSPSFSVSNASAMTNSQKFGLMIGNCCLTNKFDVATCLGEALLRKGNYCGAVGYIGGSNSTYWGEDFYWAVGVRTGIGPNMPMTYNASHLGNYDRMFHTHGEAYQQWATTMGALLMQGNMTVEGSTSGIKHYYWEIYHLMGDPSLMPYLTQAAAMTLTAAPTVAVGTGSLAVAAAPYAYVALTDTLTRTLQASGYADASGNISLTLPAQLAPGGYELTASAQQRRTAFRQLTVVSPTGAYPVVTSVSPATLEADSATPLTLTVVNIGSSSATGISLTLSADSTLLTLQPSTVTIGSLGAGDTTTVTGPVATLTPTVTDGTTLMLTGATQWTGSTDATAAAMTLNVAAPDVTMTVTPRSASLLPGQSLTVTATLTNRGHAALGVSQLSLAAGNPWITVTYDGTDFTLPVNDSMVRQLQLHADALTDSGIVVPVGVQLGGALTLRDTIYVYTGQMLAETFEGGQWQLEEWEQGSQPWSLTSATAHGGSWAARSAVGLANNGTSVMSLGFTSSHDDSLVFSYKVSSEEGYDIFACLLDNVELMSASGNVPWTRVAFPVAAGTHTVTFSYAKDYSEGAGNDCAWVDDVRLPLGARLGTDGGDTAAQEMYTSLDATFESEADDSRWHLVSGTAANGWTIGSAAANGQGRALYISNDGGLTNGYDITSRSSVFAYTTLWLDTGEYLASFDWRCQGESNYDYLRAALVPASVALVASTSSALPDGWSTTSLPAGAIALDGGHKLNLVSSWVTQQETVRVEQGGVYNLVFFWRNDHSDGTLPPAAVDNVRLMRNVSHTVSVAASHGTTVGSGIYLRGETVTVGVFAELGYAFGGWSDGNTDNPRQLTVDGDITLTATLTQHNVIQVHDTVVVYDATVDTLVVTDTLYVPVHDTIDITRHDTLWMHDTVYITVEGVDGVDGGQAKVYASQGMIVVEGAEGRAVTLYDAAGRRLDTRRDEYMPLRFDVPASGAYLVQVGQQVARRIVVIRGR